MTRTYRLDLQYRGAVFHGWQAVANNHSVEEALTQAYEKFLGVPVSIHGSGRTDAGVHARHQIGILKAECDLPDHAIELGILPYLPEGISIFRVKAMEEGWQPRPAVERHYRYFLWKAEAPPLFYREIAAGTTYDLNLDAMCEAATHIPGDRDFTSFRSSGCAARHAIRRVDRVKVLDHGDYWEFRVVGNAFLRQMVRILVGTLVEVGRGCMESSEMETLLEKKDRTLAGPTMPPQGLFLWRIKLEGDEQLVIPPTVWG